VQSTMPQVLWPGQPIVQLVPAGHCVLHVAPSVHVQLPLRHCWIDAEGCELPHPRWTTPRGRIRMATAQTPRRARMRRVTFGMVLE
jgi:hypothetical protein